MPKARSSEDDKEYWRKRYELVVDQFRCLAGRPDFALLCISLSEAPGSTR